MADPLPNTELGKGSGIMQYIELSPVAAFLLRVNHYRTRRPTCYRLIFTRPAGEVMIFTRHAGAVMIFTRSRNAATGDNSMYCMIPDPFPSSAFGIGSATPDYMLPMRSCMLAVTALLSSK